MTSVSGKRREPLPPARRRPFIRPRWYQPPRTPGSLGRSSATRRQARTGSLLPLTVRPSSGCRALRRRDHVASPTTISPGPAAPCSREPRLVVSPTAEKVRRPAAPMLPTKAGPVLPMWKRGRSPSRRRAHRRRRACRAPCAPRAGVIGLIAEGVEDHERAVAREALDETVLGADDGDGCAPHRVEQVDDVGRSVPLAVRGEAGEVGEEHGHLALDAAARERLTRIGAGPRGELVRHEGAEQLVHAMKLDAGTLQELQLLGRGAVERRRRRTRSATGPPMRRAVRARRRAIGSLARAFRPGRGRRRRPSASPRAGTRPARRPPTRTRSPSGGATPTTTGANRG